MQYYAWNIKQMKKCRERLEKKVLLHTNREKEVGPTHAERGLTPKNGYRMKWRGGEKEEGQYR